MIPNPFPKAGSGDVQVFNQPSTSADQWHTWNKPKGCSLVYMLCIGGGGGGGGGMLYNSATNHSGGGGGGGSAMGMLMVQASLLPDTLFVQVGAGGIGGTTNGYGVAGTAGTAGTRSYVSTTPSITAVVNNTVLLSGDSAGSGGAGGTTTIAAGGAGGVIGSIGNMPFAGMGYYQLIAGQAGTNTSVGANGNSIAIPTTSVCCMGGTGGGSYAAGSDTRGGDVTAITNSYLSEIRPATPAIGAVNGSGGFNILKPFFSFGGIGGGSATGAGGSGGNGGIGYYGSGGGGGGAVTAGAPDGSGGRGGDGGGGLVIIISA